MSNNIGAEPFRLENCKKKNVWEKITSNRCLINFRTSYQFHSYYDSAQYNLLKLHIIWFCMNWRNTIGKILLFIKWLHPIIFVSNIFPNSHLIQKCIHNQQLFQNSCWLCIYFWIKWRLGKIFNTKMIGWTPFSSFFLFKQVPFSLLKSKVLDWSEWNIKKPRRFWKPLIQVNVKDVRYLS